MQMVVSRAHPPDRTPMFFKLASLNDIECLFVSPILLVGLSCHLFYVKLGRSPCRSLPLTPQWSQSYDSQVPDPILRRLANKCAITCQQCQAHGRSGQCLGQRQDHAQGPSKLRKSPPTGFSQIQTDQNFKMSLCLGWSLFPIDHHLDLAHLPPSRHLWVFIHLNLPTTCAWVLVRAHSNHWTASFSK